MKPVMLTTHSVRMNIGSEYDRQYRGLEVQAAEAAGFEVSRLTSGVFGPKGEPDVILSGRNVVLRHFVGEERWLPSYVVERGGRLLIPASDEAGNWYKNLTFSTTWFSERSIGSFSLTAYNYLDEPGELRQLVRDLEELYTDESIGGQLFTKSTTKSNLSPKVRSLAELVDELTYLIGLACHNRPTEIIWSHPISIMQTESDYGIQEYRCFVVDSHVVTCSLYTDRRRSDRDYSGVADFAQSFASFYATYLPRAYCLDVAALTDGSFSVVELNDFQGSGLFADHDVKAVYAALHRGREGGNG